MNGEIENTVGLINSDTGMINDSTGLINDTNNAKYTAKGRRKHRSRERGPDKKPRTYHASSMNNIAQFKERPEEFVQYLKEEKVLDITGNSGMVKAFLIFGGVMIAIFGGLWLYNRYKNEGNDDIENRY